MVALTTTYEIYTTSALVSARVKVPAGLSSQTLTNLIVETQNDIDGVLHSKYPVAGTTTIFASGSVPPKIQNVALQLAVAKVIDTSLRQGFGVAGGTEKRDAFNKYALDQLAAIAMGEEELFDSSMNVVARLYPEQLITIVAAAAVGASMALGTGMNSRTFYDRVITARVTATSNGSQVAGTVKIWGKLDERESITENIYVAGTGDFDSQYNWYRIDRVDSDLVTGGTGTKVALLGVERRGTQYAGGRA